MRNESLTVGSFHCATRGVKHTVEVFRYTTQSLLQQRPARLPVTQRFGSLGLSNGVLPYSDRDMPDVLRFPVVLSTCLFHSSKTQKSLETSCMICPRVPTSLYDAHPCMRGLVLRRIHGAVSSEGLGAKLDPYYMGCAPRRGVPRLPLEDFSLSAPHHTMGVSLGQVQAPG